MNASNIHVMEERLIECEKRLNNAFQNRIIGYWDLNLKTDAILFSPCWRAMLGYTEKDKNYLETLDGFKKMLHPEDVERVFSQLDKYLRNQIASFIVEYRLQSKNGSYKWILAKGKITEYTSEGKPLKILGSYQDIDELERKQLENKLHKSEKRLSNALKGSNDGYWDWDLITNDVFLSPRWKSMLGYREVEIPNRIESFKMLLHPEDIQAVFAEINKHLDGKSDYFISEFRLKCKDKTYKWILSRGKVAEYTQEGNPLNFIGTHEDISDRKILEEELVKAKEAAEQSVTMKNMFLANMSHEIRTPMNAIVGFASLLNKKDLGEDLNEYVQAIITAGDSLLDIINDILDFSKIEAGLLKIEKIPINVPSLLDSLKNLMQEKALVKGIEFHLLYGKDIPTNLLGDPTRLTQVLINLISNAIKFTEQGSVTVNCKVLHKKNDRIELEFRVIDTGIGISQDKLKQIFERFTQADISTARKYGGSGLGLSIVKQLAEMQGATVKATSQLGKGSEFVFTIPYKISDEIEPEVAENILPENEVGKLNILAAEDNELNQRLIGITLSGFGFTYDIAQNGKEAVEKVKKGKYDLIMMDVQMPEMNGYEATAVIRKELKSAVPIIALTAHAMEGERSKCMKLGMNEYISKPFNEEELLHKIVSLIPAKPNLKEKETVDSQTGNKTINLNMLTHILGGKKKHIIEMLDVYLKETPKDIDCLFKSIEEKNFPAIKACAHKLQSTVLIIGVTELAEILVSIEEKSLTSSHLDEIKELYNKAFLIFETVRIEIKREKENLVKQ